MGALYIKDEHARAMAEELARQRGLTKVAAVRLALANELKKTMQPRSVAEITAELRRTSKLRFDPDVVIDKAFYDALNDEEED